MSPTFWQCSGRRVSQAGTGFLAKQAAIFVICLASGAHDIPIQSKADQAGRGAERVFMPIIHLAWRTTALVQLLAAGRRPLQQQMPAYLMRVHFEGVQACQCSAGSGAVAVPGSTLIACSHAFCVMRHWPHAPQIGSQCTPVFQRCRSL